MNEKVCGSFVCIPTSALYLFICRPQIMTLFGHFVQNPAPRLAWCSNGQHCSASMAVLNLLNETRFALFLPFFWAENIRTSCFRRRLPSLPSVSRSVCPSVSLFIHSFISTNQHLTCPCPLWPNFDEAHVLIARINRWFVGHCREKTFFEFIELFAFVFIRNLLLEKICSRPCFGVIKNVCYTNK